ncbi:carcinoembryonic antigen-related cell adhesion molecule 6-like isoform X2 [Gouania willdenowi]|uniref:carcinoembryonic antigen-related cell adhesion molecule 6-like isoform X2 n=1 Tax=Gouania willdenowi TaxID=441366 RepID=UPI001055C5AC|nr:carcinoembryonic antigen-related cell adhesion molecule 6-like isoform X2 [Gouania willdenowi]
MESSLTYLIILGALSVTEGAGLLPDGPLQKAVGDSVRFNTSKTPTETLFHSVLWKFKGETILFATPANNNTTPGYEDRIIYFPSTASLELRNLLTNDSGEYRVEIVSATADQGSTTLEVLEAVSGVTVSPNSADLLENAPVTLRCSSSGSSLTFLWMNGSTEVTASDRVQLTNENKTLNFTSVSRYDQGLYRCHVSNPVSHKISETVNITVNYGPEDTRVSPSKPPYATGSTIILMCSANSRPSPHFTWHVNSTKLPHDGEKLQLMKVTMSNNGNYSCRAFNPKTSVTVESPPVPITVTVLVVSPACSAGCIAGIVIACLVLVAGLVGGGYFYLHKKKTNRRMTDFPNTEVHQNDYVNMPNHQHDNMSSHYENVDGSHYENMSAEFRRAK